ncbi:MAG: alpha/beta hydrolase [Acidimicrobiales bacterium]
MTATSRVAMAARVLLAVVVVAVVVPWSSGRATAAPAADDDGVKITRGVPMATTDAGPLLVDVYEPTQPGTGRPAVVLVHGGAWFQGSPGDMDEQGRLLARQGWVGFSISYRLARLGQPTWPGNLFDVQRGVRWVAANAASYGADAGRIALLGSSAGAHLSALVASLGTGTPGPDEPPLPGAATTTTVTAPAAVVAGAGTPAAPPPTSPPPPPQLVKVVALWSPPAELLDLVPEGDSPPASCGDNDYCRTFWTVPFIPTMLGCGPADCRDRYVQASPPARIDGRTVPVWLANSEDEIVPIGQLQSLADSLADAKVEHEVKLLGGHQHANEYTAAVWNDMVPYLSSHLGVSTPDPIAFPARTTGPDVGLVVAVAGVVVLLGVTLAAVVALQRRERQVT